MPCLSCPRILEPTHAFRHLFYKYVLTTLNTPGTGGIRKSKILKTLPHGICILATGNKRTNKYVNSKVTGRDKCSKEKYSRIRCREGVAAWDGGFLQGVNAGMQRPHAESPNPPQTFYGLWTFFLTPPLKHPVFYEGFPCLMHFCTLFVS